MTPPRSLLALSAAAVTVLVLTGCGGFAGPDRSSDDDPPLSSYLEAFSDTGGSDDDQRARLAAQQTEREHRVAECMAHQGFEYTPDTQDVAAASAPETLPDDRDWVGRYGYGVVDAPGRDTPVDPDEQWVDPQAAYVATLAPERQQAFIDALYGSVAEAGAGEGAAEGGCLATAAREVAADDPLRGEQFAPLLEELNTLWASEPDWAGMPELNEEWAACMTEAGHTGHRLQSEAEQSIHAAWDSLWDAADPEALFDAEDPAVTALKEREVALALADLDCREQTDYRARAATAQREAEEAFVAEHRNDLEAAKTAVEQARS